MRSTVFQVPLAFVLAQSAAFVLCQATHGFNIFGDDHRIRLPVREDPYQPLVFFNDCTGSLVWTNIVLTAAHCAADFLQFKPGEYRLRKNPVVIFAKEGGQNLGSEKVVQIFLGSQRQDSPRDDWALLVLAHDRGYRAGTVREGRLQFGHYSVQDYDGATNQKIALAGYSGDLDDGAYLTGHLSCQIRSFDGSKGLFEHDCDSTRGSSGAPLLRCRWIERNCVVIGLNTAEYRGGGETSLHLSSYGFGFYSNIAIASLNFLPKLRELQDKYPISED